MAIIPTDPAASETMKVHLKGLDDLGSAKWAHPITEVQCLSGSYQGGIVSSGNTLTFDRSSQSIPNSTEMQTYVSGSYCPLVKVIEGATYYADLYVNGGSATVTTIPGSTGYGTLDNEYDVVEVIAAPYDSKAIPTETAVASALETKQHVLSAGGYISMTSGVSADRITVSAAVEIRPMGSATHAALATEGAVRSAIDAGDAATSDYASGLVADIGSAVYSSGFVTSTWVSDRYCPLELTVNNITQSANMHVVGASATINVVPGSTGYGTLDNEYSVVNVIQDPYDSRAIPTEEAVASALDGLNTTINNSGFALSSWVLNNFWQKGEVPPSSGGGGDWSYATTESAGVVMPISNGGLVIGAGGSLSLAIATSGSGASSGTIGGVICGTGLQMSGTSSAIMRLRVASNNAIGGVQVPSSRGLSLNTTDGTLVLSAAPVGASAATYASAVTSVGSGWIGGVYVMNHIESAAADAHKTKCIVPTVDAVWSANASVSSWVSNNFLSHYTGPFAVTSNDMSDNTYDIASGYVYANGTRFLVSSSNISNIGSGMPIYMILSSGGGSLTSTFSSSYSTSTGPDELVVKLAVGLGATVEQVQFGDITYGQFGGSYNGPFRVTSVGLNPYSGIDCVVDSGMYYTDTSSGTVPALPGASMFISSGMALYLKVQTSSGYDCSYVNAVPATPADGDMYFMLASNTSGYLEQTQFGNIVIPGGAGGGGGTYIFSSGITSSGGSVTLDKATTASIGGVIVGAGLAVDAGGTVSVAGGATGGYSGPFAATYSNSDPSTVNVNGGYVKWLDGNDYVNGSNGITLANGAFLYLAGSSGAAAGQKITNSSYSATILYSSGASSATYTRRTTSALYSGTTRFLWSGAQGSMWAEADLGVGTPVYVSSNTDAADSKGYVTSYRGTITVGGKLYSRTSTDEMGTLGWYSSGAVKYTASAWPLSGASTLYTMSSAFAYATSSPNLPPAGAFFTMLAENSGGSMTQHQYGTVWHEHWGDDYKGQFAITRIARASLSATTVPNFGTYPYKFVVGNGGRIYGGVNFKKGRFWAGQPISGGILMAPADVMYPKTAVAIPVAGTPTASTYTDGSTSSYQSDGLYFQYGTTNEVWFNVWSGTWPTAYGGTDQTAVASTWYTVVHSQCLEGYIPNCYSVQLGWITPNGAPQQEHEGSIAIRGRWT